MVMVWEVLEKLVDKTNANVDDIHARLANQRSIKKKLDDNGLCYVCLTQSRCESASNCMVGCCHFHISPCLTPDYLGIGGSNT